MTIRSPVRSRHLISNANDVGGGGGGGGGGGLFAPAKIRYHENPLGELSQYWEATPCTWFCTYVGVGLHNEENSRYSHLLIFWVITVGTLWTVAHGSQSTRGETGRSCVPRASLTGMTVVGFPAWGQCLYPIRHLMRSDEVSKPQDWLFKSSHCFRSWQYRSQFPKKYVHRSKAALWVKRRVQIYSTNGTHHYFWNKFIPIWRTQNLE